MRPTGNKAERAGVSGAGSLQGGLDACAACELGAWFCSWVEGTPACSTRSEQEAGTCDRQAAGRGAAAQCPPPRHAELGSGQPAPAGE